MKNLKKLYSKCILLSLTLACAVLVSACAGLLGLEEEDSYSYDRADADYSVSREYDDEDSDYRHRPERNVASVNAMDTGRRNYANEANPRVKRAILSKDVVLGMTRSEVLKSWGDPMSREVAGDGSGGHERWRYGSRLSLEGERVLIFENGRVAGWYR